MPGMGSAVTLFTIRTVHGARHAVTERIAFAAFVQGGTVDTVFCGHGASSHREIDVQI